MEIIKLKPILKDYLWGGDRLRTDFKMKSDLDKIAEAWTLSCHKDGKSIVEGGTFDGDTLENLIKNNNEIIGTNGSKFPYFPVLIKLIDAKDNLSIQVHPNNDYAQKHENEFGKTEIWYVIDCADDAQLIYGFKNEITSAEFKRSIENNTLLDVLNTVKVKKGDLFFIESGTVHAIGKGVLIAEIQQNSNSTYRVYDYGRVGADGKPRELHIKKAVDVSDTTPPKYDTKPQGEPESFNTYTKTLLTKCDLFTVNKYDITQSVKLSADENSFIHILVIDGEGDIQGRKFIKGDSFFVPASFGEFAINGKATVLATNV